MNDLRAIADRVEIEALHADAATPGDHDRSASLFTHDEVWSMPDGCEEARAGFRHLHEDWA